MVVKQIIMHLVQWLWVDVWCSHYEVIVVRQRVEHIVARVASQAAAERHSRRICRQIELSRRAVRWRRVRGLHPWRAANAGLCLLMLAQFLPWGWVRLSVSLVCVAVICGTLSSGRHWRQGGWDDR